MSMDTELERERMPVNVEFGMRGENMFFKIGNQSFLLDYKPAEPGEFEFMQKMLLSAFSSITPCVKTASEPVNARLLEALKRLSFCAQTTGGVAGRDDELRSAIEASAKAIAAAEAQQERLLQDMQVRADEREACAKVCDELFPPPGEKMAVEWAAGTIACANAIRARGQK